MTTGAEPAALAGVRVVELGEGIAGPFAARLLADLGADVVKVESPGGDVARRLEPLVRESSGDECSALFEYLNWNKRGVLLDFETDADRDSLRRLAGGADIVVESLPPGDLGRLGLEPGVLRQANPRLVVTSISSFGREGPYAGWAASDLVLQAMSGIMQFSGTSDREPLKQGLRQSFYCAGLTAAYVSIVAHYASLVVGEGAWVDVSMLECLASELVLNEAHFASFGAVQGRRPPVRDPLGGPLGGGDPLPASDGFVSIQISPQVTVERLAELLGEPGLAEPRFATTEARLRHIEELNEILARRLAAESRREFFVRASHAGCLTGVVQGARELLECPQLSSRKLFHSFAGFPAAGAPLEFPASLAELSRTPTRVRARAPRLGEHTTPVRTELAAEAARPRPMQPDSRPGTPRRGPLAGLRVLDLSYVFAGPYVGALLGDLGAEVIKIEAPHRLDQTRSSFSPFFENDPREDYWNRAGAFHVVNRSKRSFVLDLGQEDGRALLEQLVRRADVLVENFTPRVMRSWGMTYEHLASLNPRLVMLSNTGYGSTGLWAPFRAQGTTLEATMGVSNYTGYPDGPPTKVGQSYPDFLACWTGLYAIAAALVHREHTGEGQWIDLGMYQLGAAMIPEALLAYQTTGEDLPRMGNRDLGALFSGVVPAAGNDRWLAISIDTREALARLGAVTGLEMLVGQLDGLGADGVTELLEPVLTEWASRRDPVEAAALLQQAGIAAGPVRDARDLVIDPHLRARCFYEWIDCGKDRGRRPLIGRPYGWHADATSVSVQRPAPDFGEDNRYVLEDLLGLDEPAIARLYEAGVVTDSPRGVGPAAPLDVEAMIRGGVLARIDPDYQELEVRLQ